MTTGISRFYNIPNSSEVPSEGIRLPLVSEAELARALKRDWTAVHQAVETGRITPRPDGLYDLDTALREFKENTQHEKGHNNRSGSPRVKQTVDIAEKPPEIQNEIAPQSSTYATARATKEWYEAKLKKLRYEERAHSLTPTVDVETARFIEFRTLREACFQIPSRIGALLAGESDIGRCQQLLEAELTNVFGAFADEKVA